MPHVTLPTKLTAEELAARSNELANKYTELDRVREQKKAATAEFREEEQELGKAIRELSRTVRLGTEDRDVEIEERPDFIARIVRVLRTDTQEEVTDRTRPMTVDEVRDHEQASLPFGEKGSAEVADDGAGPPPAEDPETGEPLGFVGGSTEEQCEHGRARVECPKCIEELGRSMRAPKGRKARKAARS